MPCRSPLTLYKNASGQPTFVSCEAAGYGPNSVGNFRCGVCRDCRLFKAREWAIRCTHEASMHQGSCFLTLTYEEDPGSISRRDLQIFFRSLRHNLFARYQRRLDVRYFAVGEYGEQFSRPHYHVCLFGHDFLDDRYPWKKTPKGSLLYRSPLLEKAWPHGHSFIGELTEESAGYTARYSMKKITGDKEAEHYVRDFYGEQINITPEFQLSSKNPAIGLRWIEKYYRDVCRDGFVVYKAKQCPIPRYYRKYIEKNHPELHQKLKEKLNAHYQEQARETGKELFRSSKARDSKYEKLERNYERE